MSISHRSHIYRIDVVLTFFTFLTCRETVQQVRKEKNETANEFQERNKSSLDTIQQLHKQVCGLISFQNN